MGSVKSIKGFAYTPQKANQEGMFERGTIWVSTDNQKWEKADDFVFGNLINDPVKRYHYFKSEVKGRYVKTVSYTHPSPRDLSTSRMPSSA